MKLALPALVAIVASVTACQGNRDTAATETKNDNAPVAADNTDKNERDRSATAVTPGAQNENETDLKITQQIRKEVVDNDEFSMDAKNVKIVTAEGHVTLRGPVKSAKEKADIERIAKSVSGVTRLDNELEIAAN